MDAKTKKTWISVAIGLAIAFVVLGLAVVGTAFYVFRQHIDAQFVSKQAAEDEFQDARRQFAGQQPLVELSPDRHEPVIHQRTGAPTELRAVRVLAFNPRAGKLVRVSLPFWLVRMTPGRHFNFRSAGDFDFDSDRVRLTVDDIERAGPGLLLDARDPRNGALILVWTE